MEFDGSSRTGARNTTRSGHTARAIKSHPLGTQRVSSRRTKKRYDVHVGLQPWDWMRSVRLAADVRLCVGIEPACVFEFNQRVAQLVHGPCILTLDLLSDRQRLKYADPIAVG